MRKTLASILFLVVFYNSAQAENMQINVMVKPPVVTAPVSKKDVRLGDIFIIQTSDRQSLESLINMPVVGLDVGEHSRADLIAGFRRSISKLNISNSARIQFDLPETVEIRNHNRVNTNYLINLAQVAVLTKCGECKIVRIDNLVSIELFERPRHAGLVGRDQSQVTFYTHQMQPLSWTGLEVIVDAPVWQADQYIRKGDLLSEVQVTVGTHEVRLGQVSFFPGVKVDLKNFEAGRTLTRGQSIRYQDLKKPTLVKQGQVVKAVLRGDLFTVDTVVTARQNGGLSDVIQVINPLTKRNMNARVISPEEVEVIQ